MESQGGQTPAGFVMTSFRRNGVLVNETSVAASALLVSGRIPVDMTPPVRTGISFAVPGVRPAVVRFSFTDRNGAPAGEGVVTIPANGQLSRFLDEFPFYASAGHTGALTFAADVPVAVVARRSVL